MPDQPERNKTIGGYK